MIDNKEPSEHDDIPDDTTDVTPNETWPRKLNKFLIGIGVLAFGLIIVDRVSNMFEAEDLPTDAGVQQTVDTSDGTLPQATELTEVETDGEASKVMSDAETAETTDALNIDEVFGSPLVFVSASEPAYVITEEDVRIDVGGQFSDDFTLAGVTIDRVILEKAGDLMSIELPDPDTQ